jgi:hypothetical protein
MGAENNQIEEVIDGQHPFGKITDFSKSILEEETVDREYAKTGSPIQSTEKKDSEIERVDFDYSQFNQINHSETEEDEDVEEMEQSQTDFNGDLDPEEVKLNKKVQAKIAKSQSKNIVGFYVMLLRACWKWLGKTDENKLQVMHIRNEIDINKIINNHPLIYHIKQMNNEVDEWEMDEDQIEAIEEALEIFMISKNIQTSPGVNLAIAMGVPAIEMIGRALNQKRQMKNLISAVSELHQKEQKQLKMNAIKTKIIPDLEPETTDLNKMENIPSNAENQAPTKQTVIKPKTETKTTTRTVKKDKKSPVPASISPSNPE